MRALVRQTVDELAVLTGMMRGYEHKMAGAVTALMYHRVLPAETAGRYPLPSLAMPAPAFRDQVRWLVEHARVMTVGAALEALKEGTSDGPPIVCITFDDGYRDNYEIAAPILEEYGAWGTFFVTAGPILRNELLWHDRALLAWNEHGETLVERAGKAGVVSLRRSGTVTAHRWLETLKSCDARTRNALLNDYSPTVPGANAGRFALMAIEQVRALHERGHEVGSHTMNHVLLSRCDEAETTRELVDSRTAIATMTGVAPRGICYPNGDVDERVTRAARAAGFEYGCTTESGRNDRHADRMRLRRIDMNPRRISGCGGRPSASGFRGEVTLLHERMRHWLGGGAS